MKEERKKERKGGRKEEMGAPAHRGPTVCPQSGVERHTGVGSRVVCSYVVGEIFWKNTYCWLSYCMN